MAVRAFRRRHGKLMECLDAGCSFSSPHHPYPPTKPRHPFLAHFLLSSTLPHPPLPYPPFIPPNPSPATISSLSFFFLPMFDSLFFSAGSTVRLIRGDAPSWQLFFFFFFGRSLAIRQTIRPMTKTLIDDVYERGSDDDGEEVVDGMEVEQSRRSGGWEWGRCRNIQSVWRRDAGFRTVEKSQKLKLFIFPE